MSDPLRLLMAQIDDVPGELLGEFMQRAEGLGARNVQVVPSLTKKGRPGYLVYVDVPQSREADIGLLLGAELGTWGYRVLAAEHRHFDVEQHAVTLTVSLDAASYDFDLRVKTVSDAGRRLRIKAEHDDLSAICAALRGEGRDVPLAVLKSAVEVALLEHPPRARLAVRL